MGRARAEEADATIVLPDGARRYATFITLGAVAAVMERWQRSGAPTDEPPADDHHPWVPSPR